ncbi:MAG: GDP-mannose 4,6-dehydratase [Actinomycetota bacterium]|nr:GDP-mannose 4,6-dehydratase [Actinomycetota bacterium]
MRAVITGSAGFIGSHLAERLVAEGWQVTGIDAFTSYYDPADKEANLSAVRNDPRFELLRHDLVTAALAPLLADRPVVIHLAAQPGVRGSFGDGFGTYVHDNILATQRVFDAALEAGCPRVVYASSSSVYGDAAKYPCREDTTPTVPRSPYGVTKRTCEKLAEVYRELGLESVGLRFFTVYGPRQRPDMAIRRLCETAVGGKPFRRNGDGSQIRDFTYVDDAVDAIVRCLTADRPGNELNVGGGQEASLSEVIGMLESLAGRRIAIESAPVQLGDVRRTGGDTGRARQRLGWVPRTHLVDGLRAELEWVGDRRARTTGTLQLATAARDRLALAIPQAS